MRFSILVPVYNVERYIRECLDSLVNQGEYDYEIVLIDDGSTDSSGRICDEYHMKFPNLIRVVHQENQGLLMARRSAIRIAKGEYFIFIDSDDYVENTMLLLLDRIIAEHHPDMIVYHADRYNGEKYSFFRNTLYATSRLIQSDEKADYYKATLMHSISNGMCGKAVAKEIVDIAHDYSEFKHVSVGEDLLQSLPLISNAKTIYFLNDILYHYRINPNSVGRVFDFGRYESMRSVEIALNAYSEKWNINDRKNFVARHALVETVWGTLRVLSKTNRSMQGSKCRSLLDRMENDDYMIGQYKAIDRSYLSIIQRILLGVLYSKRRRTLVVMLKVLSAIK